MKFLITRMLACFLIAFIFPMSLQAQQFKWVKGGGTNSTFSRSLDWEQVHYMCTDPNGNVYAISQVGNSAITADTFHRSTAYGSDRNLLLTSYNCNGQMRWAKLIASSGGECFADGLVADSLGHVYVSGYLHNATLHIGDDTTIGVIYPASGLIQFDTSGHFKWVRYIGTNTPPSFADVTYFGTSLVLDGLNNVHFLNYIKSGMQITSAITSVYGTYDIVYNQSGVQLSVTRLDLDSEWTVRQAIIDPVTNKMYVCGEININIYGGFLTDTFYAAAFDASRNRLWMYFAGHGGDDGFTGIVMDRRKNLLFSGSSQSGRFSFNSDSVVGTDDIAVVMKTDTNGVVKWLRSFGCVGSSINGFTGITLLPNDKAAVSGGYAGKVYYSNYNPPDSSLSSLGWDAYAVIVDSAGDPQKIQSIRGDGFYEAATAITSDKVGNIYIGGQVEDSIVAGAGIPAYHSVGGETDFYVIKYGMDCSCTGIPISAYIDTGIHTIGFTYTGSTSGIDSVVWTFDDGYSATGATALHTYTASGTYRACATVYTDCSNDIYCKDVVIHYSTAATPVFSFSEVKVYPNPVADELNVTGLQEMNSYRLLSVTGMLSSTGTLPQGSNTIPMQNFVPGIYVLEMTGKDGERNIVRIVKQ